MGHIHVQTEQTIPARIEDVYAFLIDYREKRPQILTENFLNYAVEEGGRGAGTVVTYRLHAAKRERFYHMRVAEPTPGRVIKENDMSSSLVTTWTLLPTANNQQTSVQLASDWEGAKGIGGFFERTFAPLGLRRIYTQMLNNLATRLTGVSTAAR